jgi:hypothetical protein
MDRRSLLRQLLSLGTRNLAKQANGNCLVSSDRHEVKVICHALSSLYDRKLSVAKFRRGASFLAGYALSPLISEKNQLLGVPTQPNSIQQYEIARIGRREFLIIGGAVMAAAVGATLYYVSPAFRTLTTTVTNTATSTVTSTLTETKPTPVTTTVTECRTSKTTISTYRMTVSTVWYHQPAHMAQGFEMHFTIARGGKIPEVRRALASKGASHFQRTIHKQFSRKVPKRKLRIGFELEEPARSVQNSIRVTARYMEYRDGQWKGTAMPTKVLRYAKKT